MPPKPTIAAPVTSYLPHIEGRVVFWQSSNNKNNTSTLRVSFLCGFGENEIKKCLYNRFRLDRHVPPNEIIALSYIKRKCEV